MQTFHGNNGSFIYMPLVFRKLAGQEQTVGAGKWWKNRQKERKESEGGKNKKERRTAIGRKKEKREGKKREKKRQKEIERKKDRNKGRKKGREIGGFSKDFKSENAITLVIVFFLFLSLI